MQHKVCDKTIIAMHDKRVTLNIKHFLTENVGVAAKPRVTYSGPDGSTHSDFAWVEANTVNQCQEAMLNYDCINHHLYSWDYTGLVMQRLMIKHRWLAAYQSVPTTRVNLVKLFFNSVLRTNASKAVNREAPLDYKEQSELLDGILAAGGQPIMVATWPNYQIPRNQGKSSGGSNGRVLQIRQPVWTATPRRRTPERRAGMRSFAGRIILRRGRTAATPRPPPAARTGREATSPTSATSSCRMAATVTALTVEKSINLAALECRRQSLVFVVWLSTIVTHIFRTYAYLYLPLK